MKKYAFIFFAAAMAWSCNSPQNTGLATDTINQETTDTTRQIAVNKTPVTFKGLYIFGNEINTFQDCSNPEKIYWVNDSLADMGKGYEKVTEFLSYPYESVYAEVKGYLAGKSDIGYASEYENVLVVTEITKLEAKNFKTECYNYEFIALGTEPFWSVDIIPAEQRIILKEVGAEKAYEFPYQPANIGGGVHRFETTNPNNDKLVVIIREEKCSDGMSDREYNFSSEVVINGKTLKGCAIKK